MERRDPRWVSGLTLATQSQVNVLSGYSFSCDSVANRCGVWGTRAAFGCKEKQVTGLHGELLAKHRGGPQVDNPRAGDFLIIRKAAQKL